MLHFLYGLMLTLAPDPFLMGVYKNCDGLFECKEKRLVVVHRGGAATLNGVEVSLLRR